MSDIWLDGRFVPVEGAIAADDRGLLLADGVFDTTLVVGGRVFCREHHLARLHGSAAALGIEVALGVLEAAMDALAARQEFGSVRLTVTRGRGPRGLAFPPEPKPTVLGSTAPLATRVMFAPLRLALSGIRRNETSPTARLKTLSYLDAVVANRQARAEGADEALFLNTRGFVACSALSNVFLLRDDGTVLTPPLADGAIDGTMRRWVIEAAGRTGLAAEERSFAPADAAGSTLFLTNSLRLIAPASLAKDAPGPSDARLLRLMRLACEAVGAACATDPRDLGAVLPAG